MQTHALQPAAAKALIRGTLRISKVVAITATLMGTTHRPR